MVSQKLTPGEIKNKDFTRSVWGYHPKEVVQFLDEIAKCWEQVQKQEKNLLEKVQSMDEEILLWKGREGEFNKQRDKFLAEAAETKEKALQEAQRIYAEVEERANGIRKKTEDWLEMIIQQVEETERQKSNFVSAFRSALDSHYELLKNEQAMTEPLSTKLNQFLKGAIQTAAQ